MGCDIHFYVERREHSDAPWTSADEWINDDGYWTVENPFYDDRNYDLFGILANVRNGSGFAGISTGDGFVPMHDPREWPDDTECVCGIHGTRVKWGELDSIQHLCILEGICTIEDLPCILLRKMSTFESGIVSDLTE